MQLRNSRSIYSKFRYLYRNNRFSNIVDNDTTPRVDYRWRHSVENFQIIVTITWPHTYTHREKERTNPVHVYLNTMINDDPSTWCMNLTDTGWRNKCSNPRSSSPPRKGRKPSIDVEWTSNDVEGTSNDVRPEQIPNRSLPCSNSYVLRRSFIPTIIAGHPRARSAG